MSWHSSASCRDFYPRSPCGERRWFWIRFRCRSGFLSTLSLRRATTLENAAFTDAIISIHALLAESDGSTEAGRAGNIYFYPRSPCGERRHTFAPLLHDFVISIHALLAESDVQFYAMPGMFWDFYPRSPCGERPYRLRITGATRNFYPRSPCGERLISIVLLIQPIRFLSTLSLRRATVTSAASLATGQVFLSTLSLRRATNNQGRCKPGGRISIHALLAESDANATLLILEPRVFLSTLSLRRATGGLWMSLAGFWAFLSTLSLRRATTPKLSRIVPTPIFLSTLSLRRATLMWYQCNTVVKISIHALLAESDP